MLPAPDNAAVWIDGGRVHDPLLAVTARAAADAHAEPIQWASGAEPSRRAPLLLSALAPGERRIPEEVVVELTRDPTLRLLLLCADELLRPSETLHGGRVVLVGPPLTEQRIAARLRVQLADQCQRASRPADAVGGVKVRCVETSTPQAYYALVGARGLGQSPDALLPVVAPLSSSGLAFALHTRGPAAASHAARALEALGAESPHDETVAGLPERVGAQVAVVYLSANREWVVHWPNPAAGLFLVSPLRLPPAWRMTTSRPVLAVQRAAASGDVLLAVWGAAWGSRSGGTLGDDLAQLAEVAPTGGPGVLDLLIDRLRRGSGAPISALVLEVR